MVRCGTWQSIIRRFLARSLLLAGAFSLCLLLWGCHRPASDERLVSVDRLPVADEAGAPEGTTKNLTEIPASWNSDLASAKAALTAQCKEFKNRVQATQGSKDSDHDMTLTLRTDCGVSFRILQEALLAGRDQGFWRFQLACRKSTAAREIHYLIVKLPGGRDVPDTDDFYRANALRLTIELVGDNLVYRMREGSPFDDFDKAPVKEVLRNTDEIKERLRKTVEKTPKLLLIIDAASDITMQPFVDVYNIGEKVRCEWIGIGRPRD